MVSLHHFYHVYANQDCNGHEDSWKEPVDLHFNSLLKSGLSQKIDSVKIGIVGNEKSIQEFKKFVNNYGVPYEIVAKKVSGWEQVTQNALLDFSETNDGYVLYAHTKGSFNNNQLNKNWRETMTHFNIDNWRTAVKKLKKYDAVGCYWYDNSYESKDPNHPHQGQRWFAGTFWWSKLDLIRDLPLPRNKTRWDAEVWIGNIDSNKIYDLDYGRPAGSTIPK
jgi:hypothetical protein